MNPPASVASAEEIARGRELYEANCVLCHDVVGNAGGLFRRGLFPDLAYSPALASREAFAAIVLDGARAANGMAGYAGVLDADGAEAVRALHRRPGERDARRSAPRRPLTVQPVGFAAQALRPC